MLNSNAPQIYVEKYEKCVFKLCIFKALYFLLLSFLIRPQIEIKPSLDSSSFHFNSVFLAKLLC